MTQTITQIRCPNCGHAIQANIEQLVDVGQDPGIKARLLSGSLNMAQCKNCGYQGQIATPIVYHDPNKELLLTYIPVEIGMPKDEQERVIGRLINQAIQGLKAEHRKGYLFQPQAVLTVQGLVERILEADGITKEEIEAQREKLRLFEELLQTPEKDLSQFVQQHDSELDAAFFQLASLSLQATPNEQARQVANQRIETALALSSFGKELLAREAEFKAAAKALQEAGKSMTHESLLDIFINAPGEARVNALVHLSRPALDYVFFQKLTERIDAAGGDERGKLTHLRQQILELTQEIDKAQETRAAEAAALLKQIVEADDLDRAIQEALPFIDELFLGILQANIRAVQERKDQASEARLREVDRSLREAIRNSLPPGLQLAQSILEMEDLDQADALLKASADKIDQDTLGAILSAFQRLEASGNDKAAEHIREIYRRALRVSMKSKAGKRK
jgi:hypothetical protein